jgi:hypothetical protein
MSSYFLFAASKNLFEGFSLAKKGVLSGLEMPSSWPKGAFFIPWRRHLFHIIAFPNHFIVSRAYARAHTFKIFQEKICTSAPILHKLLYNNEIDRCRCGDNSDRYWGI